MQRKEIIQEINSFHFDINFFHHIISLTKNKSNTTNAIKTTLHTWRMICHEFSVVLKSILIYD